jgi:hypothetical protein
VHVGEEQILPALGAYADAAGAVHELDHRADVQRVGGVDGLRVGEQGRDDTRAVRCRARCAYRPRRPRACRR